MDHILKSVQSVLDSDKTDKEIADACPSLTEEAVHNMRKDGTELTLLPFAAIMELERLAEKETENTILLSPLRIKEYEIFQKRLHEHFADLNERQKEKMASDDSQMDDELILTIMERIEKAVFNNEEQLLEYFTYYNQNL